MGFSSYDKGDVRFISNGFYNNGVVGQVKPTPKDRVFNFLGICISAFCETTVQEPPFLPRGNGGSGLIVLEPKKQMPNDELLYYAAYINKSIRWRFSFGRMVSKTRMEKIDVKEYDGNIHPSKTINQIMPTKKPYTSSHYAINFGLVKLQNMFTVMKGKGEYREDVSSGDTPLVSATNLDNGILDYVDILPTFKSPAITVERVSGQAFVQLHDFATVPADISVLIPKDSKMPLSHLFLTATIINKERWRYSYGRKLTAGRLKRMFIPIPIDGKGETDYNLSEELLEKCYGWDTIQKAVHSKQGKQLSTLENFEVS